MTSAQHTRPHRSRRLFGALAVVSVLLVSCSSDGDDSADETPSADPSGSSGNNGSLFCQDVVKVTDFQTVEAMEILEKNAPTALKSDVAALKAALEQAEADGVSGEDLDLSGVQDEASRVIVHIQNECNIELIPM